MPTETLTKNGRAVPNVVPAVRAPDEDEVLRAEAIEQIQRERRFKVHLVVLSFVMLAVGASWVLTEYYTSPSRHTWPSSFADAPADRPRVWSTWYFYFLGVCVVALAIDAYRTYAKPYLRRPPRENEVDRKLTRLKARR